MSHAILRNTFSPILRKYPSELYISKNLFYFSKINQINNFVKPDSLSINYYIKKPTFLGYPHSVDYSSVLDITHLDYSFMFNVLTYDNIKNEYIFPQGIQVSKIKEEFEYMLTYFKMEYNYDYYLIDNNIYINFTNEQS